MIKIINVKVDEEIQLRTLEPQDAPLVFGVVDRNREYLRQFLPWVDQSRSEKDTENFITESMQSIEEGKSINFCILYQGKIAGMIGLHYIDKMNLKTEIGYWLAGDLQGYGIMTRCCKTLIDYSRKEFGMHRFELRAAVNNTRSCRIAERLGFIREGVLREANRVNGEFMDLVVYSLLPKDKKGQ